MNSATPAKQVPRTAAKKAPKRPVGRPRLKPELVRVKKSIAILPATYEYLQKRGKDGDVYNVSLGVETVVAELKSSAKVIRELRALLKKQNP
ncbi:hypothetical protein [Ottowia sp.]|uniref:hypothetical protein n=1 Tax=Ottowia sp. TaxID=1898956 RepID=UPI0025D93A7C|nr:hypothetical protein [Ottowia sp.]MBK6616647.1 hypothetical protein [Ottowia sp.]